MGAAPGAVGWPPAALCVGAGLLVGREQPGRAWASPVTPLGEAVGVVMGDPRWEEDL